MDYESGRDLQRYSRTLVALRGEVSVGKWGGGLWRPPIHYGLPSNVDVRELKCYLENGMQQQAIVEQIRAGTVNLVIQNFEFGRTAGLDEHFEMIGLDHHAGEVQQGIKVAHLEVTAAETKAQEMS
jgi:hypothetical protein